MPPYLKRARSYFTPHSHGGRELGVIPRLFCHPGEVQSLLRARPLRGHTRQSWDGDQDPAGTVVGGIL